MLVCEVEIGRDCYVNRPGGRHIAAGDRTVSYQGRWNRSARRLARYAKWRLRVLTSTPFKLDAEDVIVGC
jgi:hypothetical protein